MTILKGVPRCLPPELLYVLAQMCVAAPRARGG